MLTIKKENHSIISKDGKKAFHNIQQPFVIKKTKTQNKNTQKIRNFLNLLKGIYKKSSYLTQWWKTCMFSKDQEKDKNVHSHYFYWTPDVPASEIRQEKNIERLERRI